MFLNQSFTFITYFSTARCNWGENRPTVKSARFGSLIFSGGVLQTDPGKGRQPRHAGHQRLHRDSHPRGVRQHEDVRHGGGVRGSHQYTKQVEPDTTHSGSLPGKVKKASHNYFRNYKVLFACSRMDMFFHIASIEREVYWQLGNVVCSAYPLKNLDTIHSEVRKYLK